MHRNPATSIDRFRGRVEAVTVCPNPDNKGCGPVQAFKAYLNEIEQAIRQGNATEHTHRPALKTLVESLASDIIATNEAKRVECGAPDFVVSRKREHGPLSVGYI